MRPPSASAQELVAEADAEDRLLAEQVADGLDRVADGCRIAGAVRQEDAVRVERQDLGGRRSKRGTPVTRQPASTRQRRMLRFAPKSMATTCNGCSWSRRGGPVMQIVAIERHAIRSRDSVNDVALLRRHARDEVEPLHVRAPRAVARSVDGSLGADAAVLRPVVARGGA